MTWSPPRGAPSVALGWKVPTQELRATHSSPRGMHRLWNHLNFFFLFFLLLHFKAYNYIFQTATKQCRETLANIEPRHPSQAILSGDQFVLREMSVESRQILSITHVSMKGFVNPLLANVSVCPRSCEQRLQSEGGLPLPPFFLNNSFAIYHLDDIFHLQMGPWPFMVQWRPTLESSCPGTRSLGDGMSISVLVLLGRHLGGKRTGGHFNSITCPIPWLLWCRVPQNVFHKHAISMIKGFQVRRFAGHCISHRPCRAVQCK